jgi:hypothetical protein
MGEVDWDGDVGGEGVGELLFDVGDVPGVCQCVFEMFQYG